VAAEYPEHYLGVEERYPQLIGAYQSAGELGRTSGPLDRRTTHLIQIGACTALRSEGGVHSHTRRALAAGATPEEIYHALIVLISTAGFPAVSAAFSWVDDILEED
jgi:4-carboxymuconolactone decarboxylase